MNTCDIEQKVKVINGLFQSGFCLGRSIGKYILKKYILIIQT